MSKNWYPMINYDNCIECGACVEKCSHGVYNVDEAPKPIVIYPEGCVQGCKGCGSLCPADAITYFGDNGQTDSNGGCEGGCGCGDDCGCSAESGCC